MENQVLSRGFVFRGPNQAEQNIHKGILSAAIKQLRNLIKVF